MKVGLHQFHGVLEPVAIAMPDLPSIQQQSIPFLSGSHFTIISWPSRSLDFSSIEHIYQIEVWVMDLVTKGMKCTLPRAQFFKKALLYISLFTQNLWKYSVLFRRCSVPVFNQITYLQVFFGTSQKRTLVFCEFFRSLNINIPIQF